MYDYIDRPVMSLDRGGRFLVWATRSWVRTLHQGRCPATIIGPAFAQSKMIRGLAPFHRTMLLLNAHANETLRVRNLNCCQVSEHEALIIGLVRGMRYLRPEMIHGTVSLIIDPDQIPVLLENLSALASAMEMAGILPAPSRYGQGNAVDRSQ